MANINKSQKRLLIVLAVVLAYAGFDIISNWDNYKNFYRSQPIESIKKVKPPTFSGKSTVEKAVLYDKDWKNDPFFVSVQQKKAKMVYRRRKKRLTVQAISYEEKNPVAMINYQIVSTGETVDGYKVVKIEPNRVILKKDGKWKILQLK